MLEALLNHFRSYGMNDLEFIIVNSKLSHSQDKLHELQKRVSFAVYQETEEEEVWSTMEGGKDDMFVYDRCGRLTYFIPFPLSILNESPLVSNAILATYYRSPCGENCNQNKSLEIDEILNNMEKEVEESNTTKQESVIYVTTTEQTIAGNETSNETLVSNDLLDIIDAGIDFDMSNSSDIHNSTDYEYAPHNVSSHLNETNSTSISRAKTFFTNIYRVFFNGEKNNETLEDLNNNQVFENITSNTTDGPSKPDTELHHKHHSHHKHGHHEKNDRNGKKKSDRCVEADYEVCKNWSKKRLLFAQKCCSETRAREDILLHRSCVNFGKKRCKKIQSILKCCIKTVYTEPTTTEGPTLTTHSIDFSCCKTTEEGKVCRMVTSGDCGDDEERNPTQSK